MQLVAFLVFIGACLFLATGSLGEVVKNPEQNDSYNLENGRFFFGDPCNNPIYQFLGISDAKCSFQCYIQAGLQNGGFCQDNECQCNQEVAK